MLDWLKAILGDHYTEEIDKKISEEIGKGFVARGDFNTANEAKKQLEAQLAGRDKQLEDIKKQSGDAAALKDALEKAEADNKAAAATHKAEMTRLQKTYALQTALTGKAHDPADIMALLDMEKIELDESGKLKTDMDALLKPIRESKGYLFVEAGPPAVPPIKGAVPAEPGRGGSGLSYDAQLNQIFGL